MTYFPEITGAQIKDGSIELADLDPSIETGGSGGGIPPGVIAPFAGLIAPTGWLLCYGQFVNQSEFPTLFAAVGHSYNGGVNPGNGTFRLPDLRGRLPLGLDNIGGTDAGRLSMTNTLGGSGGVESAMLALNEMPSHTHAGTTASDSVDHTHSGTTGNDNTEHTHSGSTGTVSSDHGHSGSTGGRSAFHNHYPADNNGFVVGPALIGAAGSNRWVGQGAASGGVTNSDNQDHGHAFSTGGISANHTHAFTTGGRSAFHQHAITTGGRSATHTHSFTSGAPVGYGTQTALSKLAPYLLLNYIISTGANYVAPTNVAEMIPRSVFSAPGDILVGQGTGQETVFPAATSSGLVLVSDLAQARRMKYDDRLTPLPASSGLALVSNTALSGPKVEWADRHTPVPATTGKVLLSDLAQSSKQRWQAAGEELPLLVPWTQLPLLNNPTGATNVGVWWNYAAPYGPVRYCKTADGIVYIKGIVQYSSTTGNNLVAPAGALPVGCRPGQTLLLQAISSAGGGRRLDVLADGSLYQYDIPLNAWLSLNLSFKAEA